MGRLSTFFNDILTIIYPAREVCLICGTALDHEGGVELCTSCRSLLSFVNTGTCSRCGRPLPPGHMEEECMRCREKDVHFDGGCSVFEFGGIIQGAIYRLKYDGKKDISRAIGWFMAEALEKKDWKIDMVIPVPLHERRLAERGFNQAHFLAMEVGRERGIDVRDGWLLRTRYTESQVSLSRTERMHNVRGAFDIRKKASVKGKSVLLVDDVMTTGATLNECSRVLKNHDSGKIYCLTAACPLHIK